LKETIYTIPINEVFDMDTECPICEFIKKEEKNRIEYALGASMMEPDERIRSNEKGYCQRHTQMMYRHGNKLSHALVLETRLDYLTSSVDAFINSTKKSGKGGFLSKKKPSDLLETKAFMSLKDTSHSCVVCERLDTVFNRFINNLFHMYKADDVFKDKFYSTKGFCISHFELLCEKATEFLSYDECREFIVKLCSFEKENLERIMADVNWFTKKFDYRYKNEDWKNSKDAVPRGCLKISGYIETEE